MGRVLKVARASVTPENREEYLGAIAGLAAVAREEGRHCWLFLHPADPGRYLEFREGPSGGGNPASGLERDLEARVRDLATHDADSGIVWEEVTWPEGHGTNRESD